MSSYAVRPAINHQINPVTRALREGRVVLGACSISFASPPVAQIFGSAGFHFYYIDMEHGQTGYPELATICMASKLTGMVPIAGTTSVEDHLIARPLDAGAMGVIVPHVETAEQAAMAVRYSKYPPEGKRGVLTAGVHTEFAEPDCGELTAGQNREVLTAVKVESGLGIENIDAIAATPGLDAILIGRTDLSATIGIPGQIHHPDIRDSVERMLDAVKRHGIAGGPHIGSIEESLEWADKGATFMSYGYDGDMLMQASKQFVGGVRDLLGDRLLD